VPSDAWTIGRLLQWTAEHLKTHGSETPRLDAEVLLAAARGCQRIELYTSFDEVASDELRARFRDLVRQRAEGTPVAYLVGYREFYSHKFRVSPAVLIPRPETEFLVVSLVDRIDELAERRPQADGPISVADVGTGSGIIAVCAARHIPRVRVTAIDLSPDALAVARENAADAGVTDRITFVESDLFASVPPGERYAFIASNPPYVSDSELAALARDVQKYEPRLALAAGPTGTAVIERLIPQAAERLNPGGWLLLEISPMLEQRVANLVEADGRFERPATIKDLAQLPRVICARLAGVPV